MNAEKEEARPTTLTRIRKRDGRIVDFDQKKITNVIYKALIATEAAEPSDQATLTGVPYPKEVSLSKLAKELSDKVMTVIEYQFDKKSVPTVEEVQDVAERVLIKNDLAKAAKAYILYRHQRSKIRETKSVFIDVQNTMREYLDQTDWRVRENSNEDYSFSGLMLHTAGKVIANYILNEIYTPAMAEAHKKGYIHIHDLSHGVVGYCAGWSLKNLLIRGFGSVPNKVDTKPAKHLDVVISQMVNYLGCLQMEFAGAQAFSSVDTLLAPFVKADNLSYRQVKQNIQRLIFSLNIPSRWGCQMPFTNLTFDWVAPEDMRDEPAIVGGEPQAFTYADCQAEMDMINRAFLEVMRDGDANGRIFTFPIPTYNLTNDFNWGSENAALLFEVTAKYGTPYFQNYVGSSLDPRSIRAMCCRLNLDMSELINRPGHIFAAGDSTGSIGVVTINMNRLGYEAKNEKEFFEKLKYCMSIAKDSLEIKRKVIEKNLSNGLMPYTKAYLGTFRNHFSTIGLCGMNEACLNLIGKSIGTPEGKALTIRTLTFMRETTREFQKETGNLYNLEATPAESTSYRFAKLDRELCPDIITSGKNAPYLTNSTHLPVDETDDAIEALEHQNDIQPLYTGGTIFHTFMGERMSDAESCKRLVRKIVYNTRIPYFTITPTFSVCPDHGYIIGEHLTCPHGATVSNDGGKNKEV